MKNVKNQQEKVEIIETALLESVGGAGPDDEGDWCGISCSIFSYDVCNIDFCHSSR